ncbi:hypothetical protein [Streptomyces sp. NPDC012825]|uniref:hypothetical protein n=1 Tax=Streptomyces sp. NPDC012825 TaxID=3364851 RepID=UPI0036BD1396
MVLVACVLVCVLGDPSALLAVVSGGVADPAGLVRSVSTWPGGTAVKVSYDPRGPENVVLTVLDPTALDGST